VDGRLGKGLGMALFERPSRPLLMAMAAVAAVLIVFGLFIFVQYDFSLIAAAFVVAAAIMLVVLIRQLRR
jgi:hypothetical protein